MNGRGVRRTVSANAEPPGAPAHPRRYHAGGRARHDELSAATQRCGPPVRPLERDRARGPGRLGAVTFAPSQRLTMKIHFVWGFCMGAQGA